MPTVVERTMKPSGGDYTSAAAFEAGEQRLLVTLDEIAQAKCFAMLDDGGDAVISGWTLDATHYVRFYVADGEGHNCTRGQGYRRRITGFGHGFEPLQDFVRIEGVAIESDNNGGVGQPGDRGYHIDVGASADVRVSKGYQSLYIVNDNVYAFVFNASGGVKFWNNMACADLSQPGSRVFRIAFQNSGVVYAYNNTILGNDLGAFEYCIGADGASTPTMHAKNNVCDRGFSPDGNATAYTDGSAGTFHANSTNNLSDDATAPGSNPQINKFPVFANEANGNLHLAKNDAVCRDVGADLSADANIPFSDDIDGELRPIGAAWDVGADEFSPSMRSDFSKFPIEKLRLAA